MFIAYEIAKELITALAPLVVQIKREDLELADQLKRAAQSEVLERQPEAPLRDRARER